MPGRPCIGAPSAPNEIPAGRYRGSGGFGVDWKSPGLLLFAAPGKHNQTPVGRDDPPGVRVFAPKDSEASACRFDALLPLLMRQLAIVKPGRGIAASDKISRGRRDLGLP
jgi:hypothetical protein